MTDDTTPHRYADRIDRVNRHIAAHLSGDLSLDALADVAAMSRFHWHRVYRAVTGETLADAVRRARLNAAAVRLAHGTAPLPTVAVEAGYPNLQSFERAFRTAFERTASDVRRSRSAPPPLRAPKQKDFTMTDVTLRTVPPRVVAALVHKGPYFKVGETFTRLIGQLAPTPLMGRIGHSVALYHDDPAAVAPEDLTAHVGFEVPADAVLPDGIERITLPAGREAVAIHEGSYDGLPGTWNAVYGDWLPASGEAPAAHPPYERYLNTPMDTAPDDLRTEICVPLA